MVVSKDNTGNRLRRLGLFIAPMFLMEAVHRYTDSQTRAEAEHALSIEKGKTEEAEKKFKREKIVHGQSQQARSILEQEM